MKECAQPRQPADVTGSIVGDIAGEAERPTQGSPDRRHGPQRASPGPGVDLHQWSVEELRALACQLQLPGAAMKSRRELLQLFGA